MTEENEVDDEIVEDDGNEANNDDDRIMMEYGVGQEEEEEPSFSERNNTTSRRPVAMRRTNVLTDSKLDVSFRPTRILLYSPPRQRQKWNDTQVLPRVNWGDLFFDLFYVAGTYNVSYIVVDAPDRHGLLYAAGTFLPIMAIWQQRTYYDGRFVTEADVYHRFLNIIVLVVLGVAVEHIRTVKIMSNAKDEPSIFVFTMMLVVERLLMLVKNVEVYFKGVGQTRSVKAASLRDIRNHSYSTAFYLAALIVAGIEYYGDGIDTQVRLLASGAENTDSYSYSEEGSNTTNIPILLCLFGFIASTLVYALNVIFCFPSGGRHKEISVPVNIDFTIHRTGEWTMLMLGESVFSLLIVDVEQEGKSFFTVFYCGLLTVVLLQILHFQSQPHHANSHAMRRSKNAGILWSLMSNVYSLALVMLGAAFTFFLLASDEKALSSSSYARRSLAGGDTAYFSKTEQEAAAHLFCGSLAIVFFSLDAMTLLHLRINESKYRCVCKETKKKNATGMVLVCLRVALIGFTATLSQWDVKAKDLSIIGFLCVFAQLALRKFGGMYLSSSQIHETKDGAVVVVKGDDETGDAKWPNVTHARADSARE